LNGGIINNLVPMSTDPISSIELHIETSG